MVLLLCYSSSQHSPYLGLSCECTGLCCGTNSDSAFSVHIIINARMTVRRKFLFALCAHARSFCEFLTFDATSPHLSEPGWSAQVSLTQNFILIVTFIIWVCNLPSLTMFSGFLVQFYFFKLFIFEFFDSKKNTGGCG